MNGKCVKEKDGQAQGEEKRGFLANRAPISRWLACEPGVFSGHSSSTVYTVLLVEQAVVIWASCVVSVWFMQASYPNAKRNEMKYTYL